MLQKVDYANISASVGELKNKILNQQSGYGMNSAKFIALNKWLKLADIDSRRTDAANSVLWKETVGACPYGTLSEMRKQLVLWRHRMEEEGLDRADPGFEKFVRDGVNIPDLTGREVPECVLAVMRNELSIDNLWRKVFNEGSEKGCGDRKKVLT